MTALYNNSNNGTEYLFYISWFWVLFIGIFVKEAQNQICLSLQVDDLMSELWVEEHSVIQIVTMAGSACTHTYMFSQFNLEPRWHVLLGMDMIVVMSHIIRTYNAPASRMINWIVHMTKRGHRWIFYCMEKNVKHIHQRSEATYDILPIQQFN